MLGKLIKHEFKDTVRLFWPIFSLIIVLTPLFAFLMRLGIDDVSNWENESTIDFSYALQGGLVGYYLLIVGLFLGCQIMMALRFYRTTATNEAYLTFTLPTTSGKILFSKWLIAMLYYIISGVIALGSILFTIFVATPTSFQEMLRGFQDLLLNLDIDSFSLLALLALVFVASAASKILQFYAAIMLGQLFRSHRAIISIGFYIAMSVVIQIIGTLVLIPILFFNIFSMDMSNYSMHFFLLVIALVSSAIAGGFYFMTYLIMKKRLNVR